MKIWNLGTLFLTLVITGCAGVDGEHYVGRPGSPMWYATASPDTIAEHFRGICIAYGFKSATPEMAQCIQNESLSRRQSNSSRLAAAAQINATIAEQQPSSVRLQTTCTTWNRTTTCN